MRPPPEQLEPDEQQREGIEVPDPQAQGEILVEDHRAPDREELEAGGKVDEGNRFEGANAGAIGDDNLNQHQVEPEPNGMPEEEQRHGHIQKGAQIAECGKVCRPNNLA